MSNMAFSKTIQPMREFRKTITRRYAWHNLKPAQILWAVEKSQGLKLGEQIKSIHEIQVLTSRWERLDRMITDQAYGEREVILEGFPEMKPSEFVEMLCEMDKRRPEDLVNRIEFRHLLREALLVFEGDTYTPRMSYFPDGTMVGFVHGMKKFNKWSEATFRFEIEY